MEAIFGSLCQDLVRRDRTRVLGISLVNLVNFVCFVCEVEHDFLGVSLGWAGRQGEARCFGSGC